MADLTIQHVLLARREPPQAHQLQRGEHRGEGIAQFVTEHGEELVLGPIRLLRRVSGLRVGHFAVPQRVLGELLRRDVVKQNGHVSQRWGVDAKRIHAEPPVQRLCLLFESHRSAGQGNFSAGAKPMLLVCLSQIAHAAADRIAQASVLLEGGIDLEKHVVDGATFRVEEDLNRAESDVDRLEQRSIVVFVEARRFQKAPCGAIV